MAEEDEESENDFPPTQAPMKCSKGKKLKRGGGDPPKHPPAREKQVKDLRKKAHGLQPDEVFKLLEHPALQNRVDVNIFLIHITVGLVDLDLFSSNLVAICGVLNSSPSPCLSVTFPTLSSNFNGSMMSWEASKEAMEVMKSQSLGCLAAFHSLMSKLCLSLKVMR
jgi:hypothetical protein